MCLWRYDHRGVRLASCGRRKRGSVRCSGDASIAPTASQTNGRNLPPEGVWGGEAEGGAEGMWEGVRQRVRQRVCGRG